MKLKLKIITIKALGFLILCVKSNPKLKSILHPILIQVPFFNKIMFILKNQISSSNNIIGPLLPSPQNLNDLTQSGQSYFIKTKNTLNTLNSNANTD
jgi:hypothetical protein